MGRGASGSGRALAPAITRARPILGRAPSGNATSKAEGVRLDGKGVEPPCSVTRRTCPVTVGLLPPRAVNRTA